MFLSHFVEEIRVFYSSSEGVKKKSRFESSALIIKNDPNAEDIKIKKTVINLLFLSGFILFFY